MGSLKGALRRAQSPTEGQGSRRRVRFGMILGDIRWVLEAADSQPQCVNTPGGQAQPQPEHHRFLGHKSEGTRRQRAVTVRAMNAPSRRKGAFVKHCGIQPELKTDERWAKITFAAVVFALVGCRGSSRLRWRAAASALGPGVRLVVTRRCEGTPSD